MIRLKNNEFLTLLKAVKYTHLQTVRNDYSSSPRPCHNLAFILEGEAEIFANGKTFSCHKDEILYIPQNTTYSVVWKAEPKVIFHTIHFNFSERANPFSSVRLPVQKLTVSRFDKSYALLLEIEKLQYVKNADFYLALSAFFALFSEFFSLVQGETIDENENPILPAVNRLNENFKEKISVRELADLCYLSESRFFFLFKKYTGVSPITYKNKLAVFAACQALLSDTKKSVEEIAEEFGFESTIYFRRLFKKITGKTPSQYKKEESLL